jgi:hypothetical protein
MEEINWEELSDAQKWHLIAQIENEQYADL